MLPHTWDGNKNVLQGTSAPPSQLLSLCLSLSSQCSTAVPLCTCPDRLGESHSKFELMRNITSLHHRLFVPKLCLHMEQKVLFYRSVNELLVDVFETLKTNRQTRRLLHESNLWRCLDRAFFCLKVTLPPTNCCVQNEHSWCRFNVQYYTTSLWSVITVIHFHYHHCNPLAYNIFNSLHIVQYSWCYYL